MVKRWYVLFGLLGPSTQLTIVVVGAGIAAAAFGPGLIGLVGLGTCGAAGPGGAGTGQGGTAPSCCIGAEFSEPAAVGSEAAAGSGPSLDGTAWFWAPRGMRPVGTCATGGLAAPGSG
jgi:hypothetical protein